MTLRLDHLVILVHDLEAAIRDYRALGFRVTPGGVHADGLTHNALIPLADGCYLELIAFVDPDDPRDNLWGWRRHLAAGGGLIDYCLASDDLEADVARMRARGLNVNGPSEGGRLRPDGTQLRWRSAQIWQTGRALPFLIQDLTPRDWRVPAGEAAQHANGVVGVREVVIAVADLARVATLFAALSDLRAAPIISDARLEAQRAAFHLEEQRIVFAEPAAPHSPLQHHLQRAGVGPFEAVLIAEETPRLLDARLTHAARLRIG